MAPDGRARTTAELTADAVGHDLARGTTRFTRTVHVTRGPGAPGAEPGDEPGEEGAIGEHDRAPVDLSRAVELADDDPLPAEVPTVDRLSA